jgi:SAM-dependent methyltransferase
MEIDYSIQYAKWHDDSDQHFAESAAFYARLLRPLLGSFGPESKLLDVGCGTGLLVNALLRLGYRQVRGIDLSTHQIAVALRRSLPCEETDAEYIHRLADNEPASLDGIFLMDVLEHIPVGEQMRFSGALHRLLRPGGRLVISVPNASSTFAARWRYMDWTHQCCFTEHSLEFVLRNQGFTDVAFLPYEYGEPSRFPYVHRPAFWVGMLRRMVRGLRRLEAIGELGRQGLHVPLGLNLLAVCRKGS